MRWTLVPLLLVLAWAPAGTTELPGVGDGSITPETLFAFNESVKMIQPPPGLPQKWFSAEAEVIATVAAATSTDVYVVEPLAHSQAGRRVRISGSSAAAGQIRQILSNSSHEIDVTPPWEVPPAAGDSVEIFTGDLPPGRWDGACTQVDPCLDYYQVHLFGQEGPVWIWLDAGDVWDSDDEWCDRTHRPPNSCPDPPQNRFFAKEYSAEGIENDILFGISSTDLTGGTFPVLDCDASSNYPKASGGLFENQNGSWAPFALDGPSAWMVVQGIETRCWNRPAPGSATSFTEWGEATGIYRQEYSGKILAIHNRHGDLWDGASLVSGNGTNFTQGDRYVGGVILVDIEANTADYATMVGQCTATNTPYRSCQGTDFSGQGRGQFGDLWPRFISAAGGENVLWIGGNTPNRNKSQGVYTGVERNFIEMGGFRDYFSSSGVGGTQHVTLVNLQLAGAPDDLTAPAVVMADPIPGRWGTKYEVRILNSRFTDMPNRAPIVTFAPGGTTEKATGTSLHMEWSDVDVERYGSVFLKADSVVGESEIDGGFDWVGRCLFVDEAHPTPGNRILDVRSGTESLATRCRRHRIDLEGWIDGDDVASQFSLCSEDLASYASDVMTGTMMQPENAGGVNGWEIFARGNSGDWGGEGVDIDALGVLETLPEVQDATLGACHHAQTYPLGQTLPIGFISTPDNLISRIRLHGFRNLGFNPRGDWPPCPPPAEELSITGMTIDGTGEPVIRYADPNQPAEVTGYNVYRASAPAGPWILLDSNVQDVDTGTPGLQYVDATGDASPVWYYQVAAFNQACRAEGPW